LFIPLRVPLFLTLLGATLFLSPAATGKDKDCKNTQDCALDAREQGKIRPLSEVFAAARAVVPGEVVKVELDREDGIWVYEIKILTTSGRRRTVEINAETLAVMEID
jgi:uncharacterized membrane protein YkoI